MQIHSTHKNSSGFTLIELVIAVAIIGILTSVAVLGYNQYKVRAYDAHSKQALRDILLQCNAFWLDHDTSQVCNHATVAEVYVASDEIVLKFPAEDLPDLPGGSQGNFCASAQHESSPNTYSIDSASLISSGSDCSGTSGTVQTASTGGSVQTASVSTTAYESINRPLKGEDWECVGAHGPGTLVDKPGSLLHGHCIIKVEDEGQVYSRDHNHTTVFPSSVNPGHSPSTTGNKFAAAFQEFAAGGNAIVVKNTNWNVWQGIASTYYLAVSDGQGGLSKVDDSEEVAFSEYNSMNDQERYEEKCRASPTHPDCLPSSEWNNMSAAQRQVHWQAEHCRVMPHDSICQ